MADNRSVMTAADEDDGESFVDTTQVDDQAPDLNSLADAPKPGPKLAAAIPEREDEQIPDFDIVVDDGNQDQPEAEEEQPASQPEPRQTQRREDPNAREPRSTRRARQKAARERSVHELNRAYNEIDALRRQLNEVQQQVGSVAPRIDELTEASIRNQREGLEAKISEADRTYSRLDDEYWQAIQDGDHARARQIDRDRQNAFVQKTRYGMAVEEFDRLAKQRPARPADTDRRQAPQVETRQPPQQDRGVSPIAQRLARSFIDSDAPWYNTPGSEVDSNILGAIEASVAGSGLNPETEEFWDRVYEIAAEKLPHRFQDGDLPAPTPAAAPTPARPAPQVRPQPQVQRQAQQPVRRGPPTGAPGTARTANANSNTIRLTPERRQAALMAGLIDENNKPVDKKKFYQVASQWAAEDRATQRNGR